MPNARNALDLRAKTANIRTGITLKIVTARWFPEKSARKAEMISGILYIHVHYLSAG
jgi:hypothetical protein